MARRRGLAATMTAAAMALGAATASAAVAGPVPKAPIQTPSPAAAYAAALPDRPAALPDPAALAGVSCPSTSYCVAVGKHLAAGGRSWSGLSEVWDGTRWTARSVPGRRAGGQVTAPGEVSCGAQGACLLVGEHYQRAVEPALLAESAAGLRPAGGPGWAISQWRDPRGARMSWLGDVSCPAAGWCMAVGAVSASGFSAERDFAERWTPAGWRALAPPAPRHARWSELGALSCFAVSHCVAVGGFQDRAGRVLGFADAWDGRRWTLAALPGARGERQTIINAVACSSATSCLAVGYGAGPGERQLAERLSASGWRRMTLPGLPRGDRSLLGGVSCPAAAVCMAAGASGPHPLAELWSGGSWRMLRVPAPPGHRTGASLSHVSCPDQAYCVAVGLRYRPGSAAADRPLIEAWNGRTWRTQAAGPA